jgi:hypothetical protein
MGLKDELNKTIDDVKDAVHEGGHRSEAQAEQAKRDVAGDDMTASEKAASMANQAKNTVQADYDKTKRDLRDQT